MALSDDSKVNISIKKLAGRAQTSNDKDLANEGLPTGITMASNTIFGDQIPTDPDKSSLYAVSDGVVEYLRLSASFIPGTDTPNGRHAFSLQLPDDYVANSSNSRAGTYPFLNKQKVYITSGSLQLVPTSFSNNYEAKPYHSASNVQTQIPVLDARDWYLDYFNGILFQQDPPATGDSNQNPRYVDAFLYIGRFADVVSGGGKGDPQAEYLVLSATGSLTAERVFNPTTGLKFTDSGAGQNYTLQIDDSVVATLTGSQFSGNVGITGSFGVVGDVEVSEYIKHIGDDDTFIQFADDAIGITAGGEQLITISEAGQDIVKIGDGGDVDFQVRTLGDDNTLYVKGDIDRVGVGTNSPASILHIKEAGPTLTLQRENNSNASVIDFLGALGNTANSIIHDSSTNDLVFKTFNGSTVEEILRLGDHYGAPNRQVIFLSGSRMHDGAMQPRDCTDIAFFVSGSIGSKGSTTKGAAVFGGDLLSSGTFFAPSGLSGSLTRLTDGSSYLVGGTGINISSASNGAVTISLGSSERTKSDRLIISTISAGGDVDVSSDFNSVNFDFNKIDIFVNGQLLTSGSNRDYLLNTSKTGSIHFDFDLIKDDVVTSIVNK